MIQNTKQNTTAVIPFISGISLLVFEGRQNILFASVTFSLPSTSLLHLSEARGAMQRSLLKLQACSAVSMPAERPREGMFCFGGTYLSTPFKNDQLITLADPSSGQESAACDWVSLPGVGVGLPVHLLSLPGAAQTREAGPSRWAQAVGAAWESQVLYT